MFILSLNNIDERNILKQKEKMVRLKLSNYDAIIFEKYQKFSTFQWVISEKKWKEWVLSSITEYIAQIDMYINTKYNKIYRAERRIPQIINTKKTLKQEIAPLPPKLRKLGVKIRAINTYLRHNKLSYKRNKRIYTLILHEKQIISTKYIIQEEREKRNILGTSIYTPGPLRNGRLEVLRAGGIFTPSSIFCVTLCQNYWLDAQIGGGHTRAAWVAQHLNGNQWVEVETSSSVLTTWVGITTQGRADYSQWITQYTISSTIDGVHYSLYNGGQIFAGNTDRNTWVTYDFIPPIIAKKIRISIVSWFSHISMRLGVYIDSVTCSD